MTYTKAQIDEIFSALADEGIAMEMNTQAKEMFSIAEKSEHFRAAVTAFIQASMQSITVGGFVPKAPAMAVLVAFLLGQRSVREHGSVAPQAATDPPLSQEFIDQCIQSIDWTKDEDSPKG